MTIRAIDSTGDWVFGQGISNYLGGQAEIEQDIQTRLQCFLGDCFFDLTAGINWLNFLSGSKNQLLLNLAISSVIRNTNNVIALNQVSVTLSDATRSFSVNYNVTTVYSTTTQNFTYSLGGAA